MIPRPTSLRDAIAQAVSWQTQYAMPDWQSRLTQLSPADEAAFQAWVKQTGAPITPDYDMRGFWKEGGTTSINSNDGLPHYTDKWKTPLHKSFSGESVYANPASNPPMWNDQDQLVTPDGRVLFDEREPVRAQQLLNLYRQ